jgi:Uma2 family endonuclease
MTAMAYEPLSVAELVLNGFLDLGTPQGFRAELIEGKIVVTPPPGGDHEDCIGWIVHQVARKAATEMLFSGNKGLRLPSSDAYPKNHVIPDGTWAPLDLQLFQGAEPWMPCEGVAMVTEVTSSEPEQDRHLKRHCYARGGIPLYLLVDRERGSVTLFSDPKGDDYRDAVTHPFGKEMPLPAPFSFDLDTSRFA